MPSNPIVANSVPRWFFSNSDLNERKGKRFHNCVSLNNTKCPESLTIIYYHIFLSSLEQGTPERMNSFLFSKQFIVSSFYLKFLMYRKKDFILLCFEFPVLQNPHLIWDFPFDTFHSFFNDLDFGT